MVQSLLLAVAVAELTMPRIMLLGLVEMAEEAEAVPPSNIPAREVAVAAAAVAEAQADMLGVTLLVKNAVTE